MSRTETIEIANWSQLFENADFRKRQRLGWYLAPSGCESRGYRLLMRQGSDGLIAFGVFSALCQLMATLRKDTRESGKFINSDGTGMEPADLWEMTRIQPADFEKAVKLLSEVGWLILHPESLTKEEKEICHPSATFLPPSCQSSAGFVKGEGEGEGEGEDSSIYDTTSLDGSDATDPGKEKKTDYRDLIEWSPEDGFSGITDAIRERWQIACPSCDLTSQIARASEWLLANPAKRKRKPGRFLVNWILRAQERGGDTPSNAKNSRTESTSNRGTANEGKAAQYAL